MKLPTRHQDQVTLLKSRGMLIDDADNAEHYLEHLNYYRLSAYWLPDEADHARHTFKPETTFAGVLRRYLFDRTLRLLLLDAIECVEVSIRAKWAYEIAHRHGPHAHLSSNLAKQLDCWIKDSARMLGEIERSKETFVQHYRKTYSEATPPVWAVCEVISFGLLSRYYDNLKDVRTRRAIALAYEINHEVLASWLRHLSVVRNICAHHTRLWNREFVVTLQVPKTKHNSLSKAFVFNSRHIYNTLVALSHLTTIIGHNTRWHSQLYSLLLLHAAYLPAMGFPEDWKSRAIWQRVDIT